MLETAATHYLYSKILLLCGLLTKKLTYCLSSCKSGRRSASRTHQNTCTGNCPRCFHTADCTCRAPPCTRQCLKMRSTKKVTFQAIELYWLIARTASHPGKYLLPFMSLGNDWHVTGCQPTLTSTAMAVGHQLEPVVAHALEAGQCVQTLVLALVGARTLALVNVCKGQVAAIFTAVVTPSIPHSLPRPRTTNSTIND